MPPKRGGSKKYPPGSVLGATRKRLQRQKKDSTEPVRCHKPWVQDQPASGPMKSGTPRFPKNLDPDDRDFGNLPNPDLPYGKWGLTPRFKQGEKHGAHAYLDPDYDTRSQLMKEHGQASSQFKDASTRSKIDDDQQGGPSSMPTHREWCESKPASGPMASRSRRFDSELEQDERDFPELPQEKDHDWKGKWRETPRGGQEKPSGAHTYLDPDYDTRPQLEKEHGQASSQFKDASTRSKIDDDQQGGPSSMPTHREWCESKPASGPMASKGNRFGTSDLPEDVTPDGGCYNPMDTGHKGALPRTTADRFKDQKPEGGEYVTLPDPTIPGGRLMVPAQHPHEDTHATQNVEFLPIPSEIEKAVASDWMFKSNAVRCPDMSIAEAEDGYEDRQYSNEVLPDMASELKVNAAPGFNSKAKRFPDSKNATDAVTYLDDLIQPPPSEKQSWMFKPPSARRVPHAAELDLDTRDYEPVIPRSNAGVKFPVAGRFNKDLFPDEKPGPGAYNPGLEEGTAVGLPKDGRFKTGEVLDIPYYTIPGMADESEKTSRQADAAGLGFGSTNLRFDEEDEFDEATDA